MNNEPNIEEIAEAITNRAFDDDFKWSGHDGAVIKLSRPNLMMVVEAAITEARASDAETIARLTKERDALRLCVAEVSDRDNALLALDATRKERDIEKRRRLNYQGQVYRTATVLDGGNFGKGFITTGDGDTPTTELQEAAQRMVAERDALAAKVNELENTLTKGGDEPCAHKSQLAETVANASEVPTQLAPASPVGASNAAPEEVRPSPVAATPETERLLYLNRHEPAIATLPKLVDHAVKVEAERDAAIARAEKAEAELEAYHEKLTLAPADELRAALKGCKRYALRIQQGVFVDANTAGIINIVNRHAP